MDFAERLDGHPVLSDGLRHEALDKSGGDVKMAAADVDQAA